MLQNQRAALVLTFTVLTLGCASTFNYDNKTYTTSSAAIQAAKDDLATNLQYVPVASSPLDADLAVVIPNLQRIREKGVVTTGAVNPEQINYIAEVLSLGYKNMVENLRRSNGFRSVSILESYDPARTSVDPNRHDFVVFFDLVDQNTAQWYIRKSTSNDRQPIPLDMGVERRQRAGVWSNSVRSRAVELGAPAASMRANSRKATEPAGQSQPLSSGSGFRINRGGYILTNAHVVANCQKVTTKISGDEIELTKVEIDPENDLALLKSKGAKGPHATFLAEPAALGSNVIAAGFPLRGVLASRAGVSLGIVNNLAGPGNDARLLQISAPVQPGNSGGPLLDSSGLVVGMVVAKLDALLVAIATGDIPQNVNFAIKSSVIRSFLDASGVRFTANRTGKSLSNTAVSTKAQEMTIPIDCQ